MIGTRGLYALTAILKDGKQLHTLDVSGKLQPLPNMPTQYTEIFSAAVNVIRKVSMLLTFLLKTLIVDTRRGGSKEYPQSMFRISK